MSNKNLLANPSLARKFYKASTYTSTVQNFRRETNMRKNEHSNYLCISPFFTHTGDVTVNCHRAFFNFSMCVL
jgi:hypothetical protein